MKSIPMFVAVVGLAGVLVWPGCVMVMDPERLTEWEPEGEFSRTVDFASGGSVVLENHAGEVLVSGWDRETVEIQARGRIRHTGRSNVRLYGLWNLRPNVKVDLKADELRIRTVAPEWPAATLEVQYTVNVPASVNLREIRLDRGKIDVADVYGRLGIKAGNVDVSVRNFSGSLEAEVARGSADAEVLDIRAGDVVSIRVGRGDIVLRLEAEAAAEVTARAENGKVVSEFELETGPEGRSAAGRLGAGGASIRLETGNGDIKILKVKAAD